MNDTQLASHIMDLESKHKTYVENYEKEHNKKIQELAKIYRSLYTTLYYVKYRTGNSEYTEERVYGPFSKREFADLFIKNMKKSKFVYNLELIKCKVDDIEDNQLYKLGINDLECEKSRL